MASKQTVEEMEKTSTKLTCKELERLHKQYEENFVEQEYSSSESDSNSDEGDSDSKKPKFSLKKIHSPKKENTMLYMFKKYEQLQNETNMYKNKLYKTRMKIHSQEQKEHYKNLEFSNLLLEKETLEIELSNKKYTSFKYYTSFTLNILLSVTLIFLYINNA
jgi:hypothetical protein